MICNNNIAIIPARGGSKGLPGKNIKLLHGKPMIAYTIEAALSSQQFSRVMVSTDDQQIADVAIACGAEVPELRPDYLATDSSSTVEVVEYVINRYKNQGEQFDSLCILQPTSPLRTYNDIILAYETYKLKKAKSVVSVCECEHSPLWENTLPDNLSMANFLRPEVLNVRRQDLPTYYRLNGAIYISDINHFLKTKSFYNQDTYAYLMNKHSSVDVDDIHDFKFIEFLSGSGNATG